MSHRRSSALAPSNNLRRKWVASVLIVMVSARLLDTTDGSSIASASRPAAAQQGEAEQRVNGDFLALSDVYTASNQSSSGSSAAGSRNFRMSRSEFNGFCANGECGHGDVLKVVSMMAKRMLSDPRVLGLRTGHVDSEDHHPAEPEAEDLEAASSQALVRSSEDAESARAVSGSSFDTRPFTSNDYYYDTRNRADGGDSYAMASNGNYRNRDRYMADGSTAGYGQEGANYAGAASSSIAYDRDGYGYGGDSYGGYEDSYGGGGGGHYECCQEKDKLLPIFLIGLLGLLAFFLYLRSTTTTMMGRSFDDNDISDGKFKVRAILSSSKPKRIGDCSTLPKY